MGRGAFPKALLSALLCAGGLSARPLEMYWVDVEGGAATLIVTPAGESLLIDSGMPGARDSGRIIKAARDAGIQRIDHLITTHFHLDHFGGAADVAADLPVGTIYDNGIPDKNPDKPEDTSGSFERNIRPYREIKAEKRVVVRPGDSIPLKQATAGPSLSLQCIAGMQNTVLSRGGPRNVDCENGKEKPKDTSDNANSLAFLLKLGDFEMFDGGDLTWNTEAKLACPENLAGTVDIYDVNHHGLDVSNNPLLVRTLQPTVAIMSNGITKGCGRETFATLKATPSIKAIYQIHKNLRPDKETNTDESHIANLEKDCAANYIKVAVREDAKSYTVAIPATGHEQVFQTR